jgi:hypothetical protein
MEAAWQNAVQMPAEEWFNLYVRPYHPELALVGMRVLSQVISASSCERNWSTHGHIHSEVRNRLAPATTEKLVYVYSNLKAVAAAAHDDELKISHRIMNDAAIVHGPLCALRGSGTTARLHLARGAATQRGQLMFTEALQSEQAHATHSVQPTATCRVELQCNLLGLSARSGVDDLQNV